MGEAVGGLTLKGSTMEADIIWVVTEWNLVAALICVSIALRERRLR